MEKTVKINQLTLKIFLLIVSNDLLDTIAQLLIKIGVHHFSNFGDHDFYLFWTGAAIYVFNFFLWMNILSKIDLSIAFPLANTSYILIPFAAIIFLHEHIKPKRWLGLVFILLGIYFVSKSDPLKGKP